MEAEGSLPCLQEPSLRLYSEREESNPHHLRSILILLSDLRFGLSSDLILFCVSHQDPISISLLPHACYMACPSHPPGLDRYIL
jgi:hypothetical protein